MSDNIKKKSSNPKKHAIVIRFFCFIIYFLDDKSVPIQQQLTPPGIQLFFPPLQATSFAALQQTLSPQS